MIKLDKLNRREAVRYLGGAGIKLNYRMDVLMDECEKLVLKNAAVRYRYIDIPLPCPEITVGSDIVNHLDKCSSAVIMCVTLGAEIDKLIRVTQISDMARAVVLDSFSSVAVEQACSKVDRLIADEHSGKYLTWRFSPGYGDYPIELQGTFLRMLDSARRIGLTTNENSLLIPTKSVTAVVGVSDFPLEKKKRGCVICNMRETCKYRKDGSHCGF